MIFQKNAFDMTASTASMFNSIVNDGTIQKSDFSSPLAYLEALNDYVRTQIIINNINTPEELNYYHFVIKQMLISCRFQDQTCTDNDFMQTYDYYYGLCYRFNMGKYNNGTDKPLLKSGKAGWANGKKFFSLEKI